MVIPRDGVWTASGRIGRVLACAPALVMPLADALAGPSPPAYRDDRSTPQAVVTSLYNAVERGEYLRAWSYFRDEPGRPDFDSFAKGYEGTRHVRVRLGKAASEGAAGSIYYSLSAVVEATSAKGSVQVFSGCYRLRLVQPAAQATPPFQPMGIVKGSLAKTTASFSKAQGSCADAP